MSIFDFILSSFCVCAVVYAWFCLSSEKKKGVKYFLQSRVVELAMSILLCRLKKSKDSDELVNPCDAGNYLKLKLAEKPYEVFCCFFLDNRHRVIEFKEMFYGTINSASVHPREIVRYCLEVNAAAVIFAHNHPSGEASPSRADLAITSALKDVLRTIDVRVLDHFIVGADTVASFSERGML